MRYLDNPDITNTERSVLASLRVLVPPRQLNAAETLRIAELQANHLLRHFDIETNAVPEEIVGEMPRIRVIREEGMDVSGAAHWNGRLWIIAINADEPHVRQRFSVMHEFKHVLDHTSRHLLYYDRPFQPASEQAERVADYFAACVLMPKRIVVRLWCTGHQDIPALAAKLQVSVPALRYRLAYLGLTEPTGRCARSARLRSPARSTRATRYFRRAQILTVGGRA